MGMKCPWRVQYCCCNQYKSDYIRHEIGFEMIHKECGMMSQVVVMIELKSEMSESGHCIEFYDMLPKKKDYNIIFISI